MRERKQKCYPKALCSKKGAVEDASKKQGVFCLFLAKKKEKALFLSKRSRFFPFHSILFLFRHPRKARTIRFVGHFVAEIHHKIFLFVLFLHLLLRKESRRREVHFVEKKAAATEFPLTQEEKERAPCYAIFPLHYYYYCSLV